MSFISEKSKAIPRSAIREMFAMQDELEDVVSFALGEPDFTAPAHVLDTIIGSLQKKQTHYTPNGGIPPLREVISQTYKKRGLDYAPDEVLVGAGAVSLLLLAAWAVLDLGDEALIPDPGWANYEGQIMQVGAVPVPVRMREENGFMYDLGELEAAITDRTKVILLNSPSNPTGGVADAENIKGIAELAKKHNLVVISDEIYRELLWCDEPYVSIASLPGMKERTILVDGFSKTYAMTGLRLGYAAAPKEIIAVMTKLLENVFACVSESVQWGGVAALTGDQSPVEDMKKQYRKRRALMVGGLNEIPGVSCLQPKGAFYAFANIKSTGLSSRDFAVRLLKEKGVTVVPGNGFGAGGEGFIRLSYATGEETIREGLRRLREFAQAL